MKSLIKYLSIFFTLILVVIVGLVVFILTLDPSQYRDQITELAARQGVDLRIEGDLGWRLYPNLSLEVGQLSLGIDRPEAAYAARVERTELLVELWPLLRREFRLRGLKVVGADLVMNQKDQESTEIATQTEPAPDTAEPAGSQAPLPLIVAERMEIQRSSLQINSPTGDSVLWLQGIQVLAENLNLTGEAVPVSGRLGVVAMGGETLLAPISFDLALNLGQPLISVQIKEVEGSLHQGAAPIGFRLAGNLGFSPDEGRFELSGLNGTFADQLRLQAGITGQLEPLSYRGNISLTSSNLRRLAANLGMELEAEPGVLNRLDVSADMQGSESGVALTNLRLQLDQSNFQGSTQLGWGAVTSLRLNGQLDQLNLDAYLPPAGEEESDQESALIPVLPFNNTDIDLEVRSLQVAGIPLTRIRLLANSTTRQLRLQQLSAELFGGSFNSSGTLQLTGELPHQFDLAVSNVRIGEFLASQMETAPPISGAVSLNLAGLASGVQTDQLIATLEADGRLQANSLTFHGQNIELLVCDISDRVQRRSLQSSYTETGTSTVFQNVDATIRIQNGLARVQSLRSGIGAISVGGDISFNLQDLDYRLDLSARVDGDRTGVDGCNVPQLLRNRQIPMRCTGNASDRESLSCGVPQEFISSLITGEVTRQLTDRLLGDQPAGEEAQQPTPRNLIEGLIRRIPGQ